MCNLPEISALGNRNFPALSARPALNLAELRERTPIEPCLRCGRLLLLATRTLTIRCAEGRVETAGVCFRCVRAASLKEAA